MAAEIKVKAIDLSVRLLRKSINRGMFNPAQLKEANQLLDDLDMRKGQLLAQELGDAIKKIIKKLLV